MPSMKINTRKELYKINAWLKFKYKKMPEFSKELTGYIATLDLVLFEEPQAAKKYKEEELEELKEVMK